VRVSRECPLTGQPRSRWQEDPSCLDTLKPDADPFYDPPESQLVGYCHTRDTMLRTGILGWLRITYVFENWSAQ
jgi:hypothetical protein